MTHRHAAAKRLDTQMMEPRLCIFARWPEPGKAKTRLIPALGAAGAASVYSKLLRHTVAAARASDLEFELRVTGGSATAFTVLFGHDMTVVDQGGGDLGAKLARAGAPVILIGSDAPGLTAALLREAADRLRDHEVVIGPASDGGYYLIALRDPSPWLFADMPWSTPQVFPETLARLAHRGITPFMLAELTDIDTGEDLAAWPAFAP